MNNPFQFFHYIVKIMLIYKLNFLQNCWLCHYLPNKYILIEYFLERTRFGFFEPRQQVIRSI